MSDQKVFCVIGSDGGAIDVSDTFHGAKIKARRDGYRQVAVRFAMSGRVFILARLVSGSRGGRARWQLTQYGTDQSYTN